MRSEESGAEACDQIRENREADRGVARHSDRIRESEATSVGIIGWHRGIAIRIGRAEAAQSGCLRHSDQNREKEATVGWHRHSDRDDLGDY